MKLTLLDYWASLKRVRYNDGGDLGRVVVILGHIDAGGGGGDGDDGANDSGDDGDGDDGANDGGDDGDGGANDGGGGDHGLT